MKSWLEDIKSITLILLSLSAFVAAGTWSTLDFPGATDTVITGIDGNILVGNYFENPRLSHGFIYDGRAWTSFDVTGSTEMKVTGIAGNNIVGWYLDSGTGWGNEHGFVYNFRTLSFTSYDFPSSLYRTQFFGIDGSDIIGYSDNDYFIYNLSTNETKILNIPGSPSGIDGQYIVGSYNVRVGFNTITHGFIYDGLTSATLDMPGATNTKITGIDNGNIVGYGLLYNMDSNVWTALNMPGALNGSTHANAIDGNFIVGNYYDDNIPYSHGFLYTIPEPATILMLTFGGLLLRKRKGNQ